MSLKHLEEIDRIINANRRIAVHAVLPMVCGQASLARPLVIVELGVSREALMNRVLGMVAEEFRSEMWSVDRNPESTENITPRATFILAEAMSVRIKNLAPIDLLTIDLDELYDTTTKVWDQWRPQLSQRATALFRCTNLKKQLVYPEGYSTGLGWDNERGVIRVLEDFFNERFDETKEFVQRSVLSNDGDVWDIFHCPWGAGLTALNRKGDAL